MWPRREWLFAAWRLRASLEPVIRLEGKLPERRKIMRCRHQVRLFFFSLPTCRALKPYLGHEVNVSSGRKISSSKLETGRLKLMSEMHFRRKTK